MEGKEAGLPDKQGQFLPTEIVCIYAQPDETFYTELKKALVLWERERSIHWLEIQAGTVVERTMQDSVQQADLILLLLSPDFFVDDVCYTTMKAALQEQTTRQVPVIPILLRAVNWKQSACGQLKALPDNELPIAQWTHPDQAYGNVCQGLARFLPDLSAATSTLPTRSRLFQACDLPRGYVPRPQAFNVIKQHLLDQRGGHTTAITTALRGAGGFGKTTLALAICHDTEIQAAFPDGILWVELGEQPPRLLDLLNSLLASLEETHTGAITLQEARGRWRTALGEQTCLLVIDDVWQVEALSPLLEGGPHCVRLVTTRNDQVLPEDASRIWVDAMEPEEAVAVLRRGLPQKMGLLTSHLVLAELAKRLGYWPLLLTLAHGMLVSLISYGQSLADALKVVEEAYQTHGVTAFRLDKAEARQRTVHACLEASLQHLSQFVHQHYHAVERYQELAVFPEDTDIPITTLEIFWKGSAGLERWETKDLCIRLHRLSLLQTCDLSKGTIRLHDVLRSYLQSHAAANIPSLHVRLLNAYWQVLGLRRWADLPRSEGYLWQHLILHLCQTGHTSALQATLTDLGYLTRKALYMGVAALETDLLQASAYSRQDASAHALFVFLHRSIQPPSHLLRQAQIEASMGGLLLSHLCWDPRLASQCQKLEHELPRPFVTAWHPLPQTTALVRTLSGHTGGVSDCAVSPDGSFIVSAAWDRTLKVWDAATGAERLTLSGHTKSVNGCAVSADGSFIVSAAGDNGFEESADGRIIISTSENNTLKVWDAQTGAERFTLSGHTGSVNGCAVSPDGNFIVSASSDGTLKVWDAATGAERLTLSGHTKSVNGCAVSADGSFIVSAAGDNGFEVSADGRIIISTSENNTLKVWDAQTGAERFTLSGHTGSVNGCAVSPDGNFIVSASSDGTLKVWDATTRAERLTLSGHTKSVNGCAVSADGSFIVSAAGDSGFEVSADGRIIISTSENNTLKVWDAQTGAERFTLSGHTGSVNGCAVSPDGNFIVSASEDSTLKVWDAIKGQEHRTVSGHTDWVGGCAVSADGSIIVSASGDQTLKVWEVATGEERRTLSGHTEAVIGCAVSADGSYIVSASWDSTLKVWEVATGEERFTLSGHTGSVVGCAVSPDGRFIVSASEDSTLKVWDAATGAERFTLSSHTEAVTGCAVSPNGSYIVSASEDSTLKVWDATTGTERSTLSGHTGSVTGCAVSADGSYIVSTARDGTLKVWEVATGAERSTLEGHTEGVTGCAVSPDGRFIISASEDRTLKVWSISTGQCVVTFLVDGLLYGCAFHPDGEHLVACGDQGVFFLRLVQ